MSREFEQNKRGTPQVYPHQEGTSTFLRRMAMFVGVCGGAVAGSKLNPYQAFFKPQP